MYLNLDKNYCQDFEKAVETEWLEINNSGAYSSSTIYGLNSRKEHGLFVVPSSKNEKKINLLAKLEETVFVNDFSFELSSNQYEKSVYPNGYTHLHGFELKPFPVFHYRISDRRIDKSILLLHDKNVLIVRYELKNNGDPVKLIIKPIIAARYANNLIKDIQGINSDSYMTENVVKIAPRTDLPEINFSFQKGEYTPAALWYHNFYYKNDIKNSSNNNKEDLLNPGFFTYTLHPYDSFEIYISLDNWYDFDFEYLYRKEKEYRLNIDYRFRQYPLFIQDISKRLEIIPSVTEKLSYKCVPEYFTPDCNLRNLIVTMGDALIIQKDSSRVQKFIEFCIQELNNGLIYNDPQEEKQYQGVFADAGLQLINLCYYTYRFFNNKKFIEDTVFDALLEIVESFRKGTEFNIYMDKDGLIFSGDKHTHTGNIQFVDEKKYVIRYGKLIEINIFWLNALYIMRYFSKELKKLRLEKKFSKLIDKATNNFIEKFWDNENQRLYDFIRDDLKYNTFRFHQVYALSMPFQIIDNEKGRELLYSIKNELLTNFGLRSLSNKDTNYNSAVIPGFIMNEYNKYTGIVWPSTISDFIIGCINYGDVKEDALEITDVIENFEDLYKKDCLGYFSEFLTGEDPFLPLGNAASISNMLSILKASFYFYKAAINSETESSAKE